MPQEDYSVKVEGLDELRKALRKAEDATPKELARELKGVAAIVASRAKSIAQEKGLGRPGTSGRGTGALVKAIKPSVRGTVASIRENATRDGYKYPAVYEFSKKAGQARPFLRPAAEESRGEVEKALDSAIGRVISSAGLD